MSVPRAAEEEQPTVVLVVDDSPIDRALATSLLQKQLRAVVHVAENGAAALASISECQPDVVLTDLQMPELDGLALVEAIRRDYPFIPTILMTAHGSEEIALAALRAGAASYVNKRNLASRVAETVRDVLAVSLGARQQLRLHECWKATDFEFQLDNDATLIPVLVNHLQQYQASVRRRDETELVRVGVALHEALRNAIHHGNLELNSGLRQQDSDGYYRLAQERRQQEPFRGRRVYLRARESRHESLYVIKDEGAGFDTRRCAYDPTAAMNLDKPSGRGLFLIRTFMDEVAFNDPGNEITMIHRRHNSVERSGFVQSP
jgi:CheY-like chemotaxis protein/anti-sigma regulatory factor (Ser/Thr protein kinase)